MRLETMREAGRIGTSVVTRALTAFRTLTDHGPEWAQRRLLGERLGVWGLGVLWIALPAMAAFFLLF